MNFLIVTEPDDTHAIYVTLALESMGHQVLNFFCADYPTLQKNSVLIDNTEYRCQSKDAYQTIEHVDYDVVWWRRPRQPYLEKAKIHLEDYKFHKRENRMFHEGFTHQMAPRAWWINRKEAALRSNYKLLQLKLACDVGMTIPTTLFSNDHAEICSFYKKFHPQGVIYKPLTFQFWDEGDGLRVCYTAKIDGMNMLEKSRMDLIPGIYQVQIPKEYELRVTCFGDYIVAVKIHSQDYDESKMDWRMLHPSKLQLEPYQLPDKLVKQIRYLMRELGIVFGCLDFIVTPDGDYVFLEVNEQGQFFFIEKCCPDIPMLDIFTSFLIQQTTQFYWMKSKHCLKLHDFNDQVIRIMEKNQSQHIDVRALAQKGKSKLVEKI